MGWVRGSRSTPRSPCPPKEPIKHETKKGTLTIPGPAYLDGRDLATGLFSDRIPFWRAGVKWPVCYLPHGMKVMLVSPPGSDGQLFVEGATLCEGAVDVGFLSENPPPDRPRISWSALSGRVYISVVRVWREPPRVLFKSRWCCGVRVMPCLPTPTPTPLRVGPLGKQGKPACYLTARHLRR